MMAIKSITKRDTVKNNNEIIHIPIAINHDGKQITLIRPYKKYEGEHFDML